MFLALPLLAPLIGPSQAAKCAHVFIHICMYVHKPASTEEGEGPEVQVTFHPHQGASQREQGPLAEGLVALSHIWGWRAPYPGSVH